MGSAGQRKEWQKYFFRCYGVAKDKIHYHAVQNFNFYLNTLRSLFEQNKKK